MIFKPVRSKYFKAVLKQYTCTYTNIIFGPDILMVKSHKGVSIFNNSISCFTFVLAIQ